MEANNLTKKSTNKIVYLSFIWSLIGMLGWQTILRTVISVYQGIKLGSREAGIAAMTELISNNLLVGIITYVVMEVIILIVACLIVKKYNDKKFSLNMIGMEYRKDSLSNILKGFGIALLMQIAIIVAAVGMGLIKYLGTDFSLYPAYEVIGSVLLMFVVTAFPGFCEEILFRGVIQNYLTKTKGKIFALAVSSSLFSLMHGLMYPDLLSLFMIVVTGVVFGYLYMITDSIYLPIGLHFAWDFYNEITRCGNPLFNVRKVLSFELLPENYDSVLIISIVVYLAVLIGSMIINRKRTNSSISKTI